MRQTAKAEAAWAKARELGAGDAKLLLQLGHQYQGRASRPTRALVMSWLVADPREINALISLAVLSEKNHQLEEARAWVGKGLAVNPSDEQARYFSALLDHRENKLAEAERGLRELIASEPKHPSTMLTLLPLTARPDTGPNRAFEHQLTK